MKRSLLFLALAGSFLSFPFDVQAQLNPPKIRFAEIGPPLFAGIREISIHGEHLLPVTSLKLGEKSYNVSLSHQEGTNHSIVFTAKGEVEGKEITVMTANGVAKYTLPKKVAPPPVARKDDKPIPSNQPPVIQIVDVGPPLFAGYREISVSGKNLLPVSSLTLNGKSRDVGSWVQEQDRSSFLFTSKGDPEGQEIVLKTSAGTTQYTFPKKAPPPPLIPTISSIDKTNVEPGEIVTVYGKNFTAEEGGQKKINYKQSYLVQGKKETLVITNAGKNRGAEQSLFFMAPKEASGSYSFKILTHSGSDVTWDNPPLTIAKKAPPPPLIPLIISFDKMKMEVKEFLILYGKNLVARDSSGFTSINLSRMFFVKEGVESRVMAISGGYGKGADEGIRFSAPNQAGSYSIKIVATTGEIITWNNPLLTVVDTVAEELARKKALEEEAAKKKAEEVALAKQKAEEELRLAKEAEAEAKRQKELAEELARRQKEEELRRQGETVQPPPPPQQEEKEAPAVAGPYCNPDTPRYSQPGCIDPAEEEAPVSTQGQPCNPDVPSYAQPGCISPQTEEAPPSTQGQPCNPDVPRYAQPGCVE